MVEWVRSLDGHDCICVCRYTPTRDALFQGAKAAASSLLEFSGKIESHFCEPAGGREAWPEVVTREDARHAWLLDGCCKGLAAVGRAQQQKNRHRAVCLSLLITAVVTRQGREWGEKDLRWPADLLLVVQMASDCYFQGHFEGLHVGCISTSSRVGRSTEWSDNCSSTSVKPGRHGDFDDVELLRSELEHLRLQAVEEAAHSKLLKTEALECRSEATAAQVQLVALQQRSDAQARCLSNLRGELKAASAQCLVESARANRAEQCESRASAERKAEAVAAQRYRSELKVAGICHRKGAKQKQDEVQQLKSSLMRSEHAAAVLRETATNAERVRMQLVEAEVARDRAEFGREQEEEMVNALRDQIVQERLKWGETLTEVGSWQVRTGVVHEEVGGKVKQEVELDLEDDDRQTAASAASIVKSDRVTPRGSVATLLQRPKDTPPWRLRVPPLLRTHVARVMG